MGVPANSVQAASDGSFLHWPRLHTKIQAIGSCRADIYRTVIAAVFLSERGAGSLTVSVAATVLFWPANPNSFAWLGQHPRSWLRSADSPLPHRRRWGVQHKTRPETFSERYIGLLQCYNTSLPALLQASPVLAGLQTASLDNRELPSQRAYHPACSQKKCIYFDTKALRHSKPQGK